MKDMIYEYLKSITLIFGSITVIYTGLWSTGLAPITNSKAENMINNAVSKESRIIQQSLKDIEQKFEIVDDLERGMAVTAEKSKNTETNVQRILDEIRLLRTEMKNRANQQ